MALRWPASASPKKSQFFLPKAVGRMAFSMRVVVDLEATVFKIDTKQRPIGERIIDGLAKSAARQNNGASF
jgi:hypothetical protein